MTTTIETTELEQLRAEVVRLRKETRRQSRELGHLHLAGDESEEGKAPPNTTILELMPHDMRCAVLECVGGDEWMSALPLVSRGLRDLCARKEMRDAVRKWAMGVFKRGMDLFYGFSGAVLDKSNGNALIRKAAKAGLRMARRKFCSSEEDLFTFAQAEFQGSAGETEASGGPCVHAAWKLGAHYASGIGVDKDHSRALELFHHAVEVDKNQGAMVILAHAYRLGEFGLHRDYERALSLYKRVAALGYWESYTGCSELWDAEGRCGVEVDLKQAVYWLELANEQLGGELDRFIENIRDEMAVEFEMDETDETD